ncbi:MAG TPA: hypothetical protein PLO37_14180 [Candidatus Hydrogenedentes bacterium]|nr:hypothetical protein [Candidatus Hydrogenedentota bacterium]HPG67993.1 hypothetical protein [Candidatus Hydrogenedentota bacterium]
MDFYDSFLWPAMELIGLDNLWGEIIVRRFQLVYYDWPIALFFLASTAASVRYFRRRKRADETEPAKMVGRRGKVFLCVYVVLGGTVFFNAPVLTHAMFRWTTVDYMRSVAWSLGVAALPCLVLYGLKVIRKFQAAKQWRAFLTLIPIVHTVMALFYVMGPLTAIE